MILAATQTGKTGGSQQQCSDVVLTPDNGTTPLTVLLQTSTAGAHIFYTKHIAGVDPTHSGDSATGTTIRIGNSSGSVPTGTGNKIIRALAYAPGFLDSNITEGDYEVGT